MWPPLAFEATPQAIRSRVYRLLSCAAGESARLLIARRLGTVYARLILLSCPGRALGDATLRCVVWSASLVVTTHGTPAARHQFVRSVISASSSGASGAVWGCHKPAPPRPRSSLGRPSLIPSGLSRPASNLASRAISASRLYCTPC